MSTIEPAAPATSLRRSARSGGRRRTTLTVALTIAALLVSAIPPAALSRGPASATTPAVAAVLEPIAGDPSADAGASRAAPPTSDVGRAATPTRAIGSAARVRTANDLAAHVPKPGKGRAVPLGESDRGSVDAGSAASKIEKMRARAPISSTTITTQGVSPSPSAAFLGHQRGPGDSIPPDTHGAVGPNHVVAASNFTVDIRSRTGTSLAAYALDSFWGHTSGTNSAFDPRITYDAANDRWTLVALATGAEPDTTGPSRLLVAVTQGADPTGTWWTYEFLVRSGAEPTTLWADFPAVGQNAKWIVISANMISGGAAVESRVWALTKSTLYAGTDCSVVSCGAAFWRASFDAVWDLDNNDATNPLSEIFTLQPAIVHDAGQGDVVMTATWWDKSTTYGTSQYLIFFRITGAAGAESMTYDQARLATTAWSHYATSGDVTPNVAPQAGTTDKIHNGDARMQKCVVRNGTLWCVHHIHLPVGSAASRTAVQWFRLTPSVSPGTVPTLVEQGRLDEPGVWRAYPSIDVNTTGDALIGWTRFSATTYPAAAYAVRRAADAAGTIGTEIILQAGVASYPASSSTVDGFGRLRWGDYSAVQVDPVDGTTLWTIQEYAAAQEAGVGEWAMQWGKVPVSGSQASPVANFTASPTTGSAPLNVQFTDTSSGGPTSWSWTFGDGGTSTAQSPSHQYAGAGTYTVTLTATNIAGSDGETKTGYITVGTAAGAPVASFTAAPASGVDPLTVTLTDTSSNSPTSRTWRLYDTDGSELVFDPPLTANPQVLDSVAPGIYDIELVVANGSGSDSHRVDSAVVVYPANDDFADATPITALGGASTPADITWNDTADIPTAETGEKDALAGCLRSQPGATISNTVWYRLTLSTNAVVTIATADFTGAGPDSTLDTILEVGTGTSAATFTPLACNDDSGDTLQSRLTNVGLQANKPYHIRVGGWGGDYGRIALYVFGTSDGTAPSVKLTSPIRLAKGDMTGSAVPATFRWTASDGATGTGLAGFEIQRRRCTTTCSGTWETFKAGIAGTVRSQTLPTFGNYEYRVKAFDRAANVRYSAGVRLRLSVIQNSSTRIGLTALRWKRNVSNTNAWGGSFAQSVGTNGRATLRFTGRQVAFVAFFSRKAGTATVWIDGAKRATISLPISSTGLRRVVFVRTFSSTGSHTIQIRDAGGVIGLDAIVVAR